jgi:hypothetical protein
MVLKEWGEIRGLYRTALRRVRRAPLPFSWRKWRCYWSAWVLAGLLVSALLYYYDRLANHLTTSWENLGAMVVIGALEILMFPRFDAGFATEFKGEYATHGLKDFPRWKRKGHLRYALFLRALDKRGYTSDSIRKLKDFMLVSENPAPNPRLSQHPLMVTILTTIMTVLAIEAVKRSAFWQSRYWWVVFFVLFLLWKLITWLHTLSELPIRSTQTFQRFLEWAERDIEGQQFLRLRRLPAEAPGPHGPSR